MRTNVEINDKLMAEAIRLSKAKTKKQAIEMALQSFVSSLRRKKMLYLKGKVSWEGDLSEMRSA